MKKFVTAMLVLALFISCTTFSMAEQDALKTIHISFKVGESTILINDKSVEVNTPYVVNGVTLVPLRVITEAFGAELVWNGEEKSVLLTYSNVTIKLYVNQKICTVNGVETELLEAPVIQNNVTMVPLRFITENFGADVGYNSATNEITIKKDISSTTSAVDFSLLLKKTDLSRVGDSHYNWSMNLPKDMVITYRNFAGTYTTFYSETYNYGVQVSIYNLDGDTAASLNSNFLTNINEEFTLSKHAMTVEQGIDTLYYEYKNKNYYYHDKTLVSNGKYYEMIVHTKNDSSLKLNTSRCMDMVNSFTLGFGEDGTVENLSDIKSNGYRTYIDDDFGWSMDVLPEWYDHIDEDIPNEVRFYSYNAAEKAIEEVYAFVYSNSENLNLEQLTQRELEFYKNKYNPDIVVVAPPTDSTLNGIPCKILNLTLKYKKNPEYITEYLFVEGDYYYSVGYQIDASIQANAAERAKIKKMLLSFKMETLDTDEVGAYLDTTRLNIPEVMQPMSNKNYKWSLSLPSTWSKTDDNDGVKNISYVNSNSTMSFSMFISNDENVPLSELINYLDKNTYVKSPEGILNINKSMINDKGTIVYKYEFSVYGEEINRTEYHYILSKNGYLYMFVIGINDFYKSGKMLELAEDIWKGIVLD